MPGILLTVCQDVDIISFYSRRPTPREMAKGNQPTIDVVQLGQARIIEFLDKFIYKYFTNVKNIYIFFLY